MHASWCKLVQAGGVCVLQHALLNILVGNAHDNQLVQAC